MLAPVGPSSNETLGLMDMVLRWPQRKTPSMTLSDVEKEVTFFTIVLVTHCPLKEI